MDNKLVEEFVTLTLLELRNELTLDQKDRLAYLKKEISEINDTISKQDKPE